MNIFKRRKSSKIKSWLKRGSTSTRDVASYYDQWADQYDTDVGSWDYRAPDYAAGLLEKHVPPKSRRILDAGCGTGLTGRELRQRGYQNIIGMDISFDSLCMAHSAATYNLLLQQDLQHQPFPLITDSFDAVMCIGVLAYIADAESLFREFARLTKPGGYIVFSQRNDLFDERNYEKMLDMFQNERVWQRISVSDPMKYLPENDEFADTLLVIYCVLRVIK